MTPTIERQIEEAITQLITVRADLHNRIFAATGRVPERTLGQLETAEVQTNMEVYHKLNRTMMNLGGVAGLASTHPLPHQPQTQEIS